MAAKVIDVFVEFVKIGEFTTEQYEKYMGHPYRAYHLCNVL